MEELYSFLKIALESRLISSPEKLLEVVSAAATTFTVETNHKVSFEISEATRKETIFLSFNKFAFAQRIENTSKLELYSNKEGRTLKESHFEELI